MLRISTFAVATLIALSLADTAFAQVIGGSIQSPFGTGQVVVQFPMPIPLVK